MEDMAFELDLKKINGFYSVEEREFQSREIA